MNVFVRFAGCNMRCTEKAGPKSPGGFDCDTEFESGRKVGLQELADWCIQAIDIAGGPLLMPEEKEGGFRALYHWKEPWIILTGGEPGLQVDKEMVDFWHSRGVKLAIETNGTIGGLDELGIDWITVSPKVAEHAIKQLKANEVKYVRGFGQGIPRTMVQADHYLISPAFDGGMVHPKTLEWCLKLIRDNPSWRLSVQQHKGWRVR